MAVNIKILFINILINNIIHIILLYFYFIVNIFNYKF